MASARGRRDHGVPEMLLGTNVKAFARPSTKPMQSSRFQKHSEHLPARYLSEMTPFSSPLYDARVHVARAKAHFKRKLFHLTQTLIRVDKNHNGLIPRSEVRRCLAGSGILLPHAEVETMLNAAAAQDGEIYWRSITLRLARIEFNANDGLDQVELSLIAGEFASAFDADGDGATTVKEIESTFAGFDTDGDGCIGAKELGSVMRELGTPRKMGRGELYSTHTGDKFSRVIYGGKGQEGAYTSQSKKKSHSARY